jgi:capsular polysaccharide biosynthesis protein
MTPRTGNRAVISVLSVVEPYARFAHQALTRLMTAVMARLRFIRMPWRHEPPRRLEPDPDGFARLPGVELLPREPPAERLRVLPPGAEVSRDFSLAQRVVFPATYVALIKGGRVVGSEGAVLGPDGTLFADVANRSNFKDPIAHPVLRRLALPPIQEVSGRVAVLTTAYASFYYHWMVDVLPRFRVLGEMLQAADPILIPSSAPFQAESLARLGISSDRIIRPTRRSHLRADELVVPSLPSTLSQVRPESIRYVRDLFGVPDAVGAPSGGRRLWVSRSRASRRRVVNEAEVLERLTPLGFESVDPDGLTVESQARTFAEAEVVVGPHGGGLTNVLFCAPGTRVIELFSPDHIPVVYWSLAEGAGLSYEFVLGRPQSRRGRPRSQWADILVDCDELSLRLSRSGRAVASP